jgi:hypothetical protein
MTQATIIGYGLTSDLIARFGPEPATVAAHIRRLGIDGVFLKTLDTATMAALRDAGLAVYASHAVFLADAVLWERYPHSRPLTAVGEPAPVEEWYHPALPTDAAFRAMRLAQVETLLAQWPLDGLWLDFIRWPARWEKPTPNLYQSSFDARTLAQFAAETGTPLPGAHADVAAWILAHAADAWAAWRCAQIAAFVADVAARRDRLRPAATLGLFTIPWVGTALDDLPVTDAHIRIVGQDPALLSRHADVLSPMVYHRLCRRRADWPAAVTATLAARVDVPVWPVIERLADDHTYALEEYHTVLADCAREGAGPVIVFNLAGLLAETI